MLIVLFSGHIFAHSQDVPEDSLKPQAKLRILPFALYHNLTKWGFGSVVSYKGFVQEQTLMKVGGLITTSGTYYSFFQVESFQVPFFPRLYIRPDLYFGRLKNLKTYVVASEPGTAPAGSNESKPDSYVRREGVDQWYECTFKYLLPFGDGKEVFIYPRFNKGILISGEAGGDDLLNPLESGRSFIDIKAFYRNDDLKLDNGLEIHPITFGFEYGLTWENVDYFINPTKGNYYKLSLLNDWGAWGSNSEFTALKADLRWYVPIYNREAGDAPRVLAFNLYTMDTPTWNDVKSKTILPDGSTHITYKRPQFFLGTNLGGIRKLRGFEDYRFYDRAMIYYAAELRQNLKWNPMDYSEFTRSIGIDFFQLTAFAEMGRVAPEWDLGLLHKNMQWTVGGGIRVFMDGLLVRIDYGVGPEGSLIQMFVDHPF